MKKERAEYHIRAANGMRPWLEIEAFQHAAAANDIERAERIIEGKGILCTLSWCGGAMLDWLASLPKTVLNARPRCA